ncbi:MAG: hypothetical protein IKW85_09640 [Muribaculaceae bacterium]|nr:hypothetical protein [Muribaculaceae bacterium]
MKKILLLILILMVSLTAGAQAIPKTKSSKAKTTTKVQFTNGQYIACTQNNVVLRKSPSASAASAGKVSKLGMDDVFDFVYIKYLGKTQNGYLYVDAIYVHDFSEKHVKAWMPKKYAKAACKRCRGLGEDSNTWKKCTSCKGRGY